MRNRKDRADLQPPFKQKDLLSIGHFIDHCLKYDIKTDRQELEYYDEEGLLLPAVRVNRGLAEYKRVLADYDGKGSYEWRYIPKGQLKLAKSEYKVKKIEKQTYYSHGSLLTGREGWLDWYLNRNMVIYPAQKRFQPWKKYTRLKTWSPNYKELGKAYETFYSPLQMYPLRFIQDRRSVTIKNSGLFISSEAWKGRGERIKEMFTKDLSNDFIRSKVVDYYKLFALLIEIENCWEDREMKRMQKEREAVEIIEEIRERSRFGKVDKLNIEKEVDKNLKSTVVQLLQDYRFSVDSLENWRLTFLGFGTFGLRMKVFRLRQPYLRSINEETLANTEDPYKIVYLLNWFIGLCGGKKTTIKELILGFSGSFCQFCKDPYQPKRTDQTNCLSEACQRLNRLKRQKEWRERQAASKV